VNKDTLSPSDEGQACVNPSGGLLSVHGSCHLLDCKLHREAPFPPNHNPEITHTMKPKPENENNDEGIKPTLHENSWEVRIAEMRLRGGSILETWYPLLASILSHVGQTAVLTARSAGLVKDADAYRRNMDTARFCAAVRASLVLFNEGGAEYASKKLERITDGHEPDTAKEMVENWIATVKQLPAPHFPMMDTKVMVAMRIREDEEENTIELVFDETLCGKNLHHPDDKDAQEAMANEMAKQEKHMGITNKVPPILSDDEKPRDGVDEDGTTTTTKDVGGFIEVRKTKDRTPTPPKKPAKNDKKSLNDFLDEMLSKQAEESDKRAKDAKDKRDAEDDEPLPPSRFN